LCSGLSKGDIPYANVTTLSLRSESSGDFRVAFSLHYVSLFKTDFDMEEYILLKRDCTVTRTLLLLLLHWKLITDICSVYLNKVCVFS